MDKFLRKRKPKKLANKWTKAFYDGVALTFQEVSAQSLAQSCVIPRPRKQANPFWKEVDACLLQKFPGLVAAMKSAFAYLEGEVKWDARKSELRKHRWPIESIGFLPVTIKSPTKKKTYTARSWRVLQTPQFPTCVTKPPADSAASRDEYVLMR